MALAYIGLGSNLSREVNAVVESPTMQLHRALKSISQHPQIRLCTASSFYRTPAIGPGDQPDYINAAAQLDTTLAPLALLDYLQTIEYQQGRVRNIRWGARTLDLDILLYGQLETSCERLILPHPRITERPFVLVPLADLDGNISMPNGENIRDLLANCSMQGIVKL